MVEWVNKNVGRRGLEKPEWHHAQSGSFPSIRSASSCSISMWQETKIQVTFSVVCGCRCHWINFSQSRRRFVWEHKSERKYSRSEKSSDTKQVCVYFPCCTVRFQWSQIRNKNAIQTFYSARFFLFTLFPPKFEIVTRWKIFFSLIFLWFETLKTIFGIISRILWRWGLKWSSTFGKGGWGFSVSDDTSLIDFKGSLALKTSLFSSRNCWRHLAIK